MLYKPTFDSQEDEEYTINIPVNIQIKLFKQIMMVEHKVQPFFLEVNMNNDDTVKMLMEQTKLDHIRITAVSDYFKLTIRSASKDNCHIVLDKVNMETTM